MKKFAITGGKGGTGKSTIAVLLANKIVSEGKKVVLVDCDVECPNDHLLVGTKLKSPKKTVKAKFPILDKTKCTKCGLCVKTCKENAIFKAPGDYPTFLHELCSGCGACWIVCPEKAISAKEAQIGEVFVSEPKKGLHLVTGVAKPVLEETSPVVRETKKFAHDYAEKLGADYILYDTAAGTHCPVIMALMGAEAAYAVTEPTPMGAHDLNLILKLCEKLNVPAEVVINQSDLADKKEIEKIAKEFNIAVAFELKYSEELAKAYSKGELLEWEDSIKYRV